MAPKKKKVHSRRPDMGGGGGGGSGHGAGGPGVGAPHGEGGAFKGPRVRDPFAPVAEEEGAHHRRSRGSGSGAAGLVIMHNGRPLRIAVPELTPGLQVVACVDLHSRMRPCAHPNTRALRSSKWAARTASRACGRRGGTGCAAALRGRNLTLTVPIDSASAAAAAMRHSRMHIYVFGFVFVFVTRGAAAVGGGEAGVSEVRRARELGYAFGVCRIHSVSDEDVLRTLDEITLDENFVDAPDEIDAVRAARCRRRRRRRTQRARISCAVAQAIVQRAQLAFTVVLEAAAVGQMESIPAMTASLAELAVLVTIHEQVCVCVGEIGRASCRERVLLIV